MLQYLLDTDHVTLYQRGHPQVLQQVAAAQQAQTVGISAVTVEESLRGWLALVARAHDGATRIRRYGQLIETVELFHQFPMVAFDQACENQFQQHRAVRIGTQDLKIAATALANQLVLVTRNHRDFARVPGIVLDDWSK